MITLLLSLIYHYADDINIKNLMKGCLLSMKEKETNKNYPVDLNEDNNIFYGLKLDDNQRKFRDAIWDEKNIVTICNAKAGTGKTTIAVATANLLCEYNRYKGIVYVVSPSMEEKQGYLPGDQTAKSAPYMEPLCEALISIGLDPQKVIIDQNNPQALKNGTAYVEFMTHTFLRGTNFENKVIIIDESQNYYFDELKKVLTRIHDNCKIIIIGHTEQCDLYKNSKMSGFKYYLDAFNNIKDDERVAVCNLTKNYRGWFSTFCDNVPIPVTGTDVQTVNNLTGKKYSKPYFLPVNLKSSTSAVD